MNKISSLLAIFAILLSVGSISVVEYYKHKKIDYGFVNTEKLLNSFVESQKALDEIRAEEDRWIKERSVIEDSLKAFEKRIAATYSKLSVDEKRKIK